mmetsp:Transcript_26768/g.55902  ORF Transcript_26768/g.55902 Transcript_26768/m.55902 type:complete len:288 (+) Transcript_26768:1119-1982(+)
MPGRMEDRRVRRWLIDSTLSPSKGGATRVRMRGSSFLNTPWTGAPAATTSEMHPHTRLTLTVSPLALSATLNRLARTFTPTFSATSALIMLEMHLQPTPSRSYLVSPMTFTTVGTKATLSSAEGAAAQKGTATVQTASTRALWAARSSAVTVEEREATSDLRARGRRADWKVLSVVGTSEGDWRAERTRGSKIPSATTSSWPLAETMDSRAARMDLLDLLLVVFPWAATRFSTTTFRASGFVSPHQPRSSHPSPFGDVDTRLPRDSAIFTAFRVARGAVYFLKTGAT